MKLVIFLTYTIAAFNLNAAVGEFFVSDQIDTTKTWAADDSLTGKIQGVSSERALTEYPLDLVKAQVIVAVIDSGINVNHKFLQDQIWINQSEIPNNGIDDDGNGYIDDINGWNFLGNKKGMATFLKNGQHYNLFQGNPNYQVQALSYAMTREYLRLKKKDSLSSDEAKELADLAKEIEEKRTRAQSQLVIIKNDLKIFLKSKSTLQRSGLRSFTLKDINNFNPRNQFQKEAKQTLLDLFAYGYKSVDIFEDEINELNITLNINLNTTQDTRQLIVQDFENQKNYGNNDVIGTNPVHGTHVAGIIAASFNQDNGHKGIAPNAKIMAIRALAKGDEHDKDIANAIYYAVDNGAHIINMSFGKYYADDIDLIADAVNYAEKNNVLIINSAGNSYLNIDEKKHYPLGSVNGQLASNFLVIGASSQEANHSFVARFSNFGKETVDFFAPGVEILSTTPDNDYKSLSGTSMAAPITSAVAALILGYDSSLTPHEVINLMATTVDTYDDLMIYKPLIGEIKFSELSKYGGKINAYKAISKLLNYN